MTKPWSQWTITEHLDAAHRLFDEARRTPNMNGLHQTLIRAQAHSEAAATLARVGPTQVAYVAPSDPVQDVLDGLDGELADIKTMPVDVQRRRGVEFLKRLRKLTDDLERRRNKLALDVFGVMERDRILVTPEPARVHIVAVAYNGTVSAIVRRDVGALIRDLIDNHGTPEATYPEDIEGVVEQIEGETGYTLSYQTQEV